MENTMSRLFLILLTLLLGPLSVTVVATEKDERKRQLTQLYIEYQSNLNARDGDAAYGLAKKIYRLTVDVYGENTIDHAIAAFHLAELGNSLRNYKASARYYQIYMDILDHLQTPKDLAYLSKLGELARMHRNAQNIDNAVKYAREAFELAQELGVPPDVLAEYELKLGMSYFIDYHNARASRYHITKAYDRFKKIYGEKHVKTAEAQFWRLKFYSGSGRGKRVAKRLEDILDIYEKSYPKGAYQILQVHAFLAGTYQEMGRADKATKHVIAVATERPDGFDRYLTPLYRVEPTYPLDALNGHREGQVETEFTVDELGQVKDIRTVGGTNVKYFEEATYEALKKFRFAPTIRNGKRIEMEGVRFRQGFKIVD